ncbi:outer membrane protein assembly factor BamB family protein [Plantactinospora sonchi]|uniref:PQQ-binding-like beta-propeller repeat protein n=1 Tax=Plantactinospora sonchi TaxID=1544735 RepID=A0ABU7S2I2_9ACTN
MPTIELGELGPGSTGGPVRAVGGGSGRDIGRSAQGRRDSLRYGLVAVLAGALTLVTAGNPLPRPLPELSVPARLGAAVYAVGEWLFVSDPLGPGAAGQDLVAYRIPTDARDAPAELVPRWRTVLPPGELHTPTVLGATLVLSTRSYRVADDPGRVLALDLDTGVVRWTREAYLEVVNPAGQLLFAGPPESSVDPPGATLHAVDPHSGAVRWSLPGPAGVRRHYPWLGGAAPPSVVVVEPSGRVETRDTGTAALIRTIELPPPGDGRDPRWHGGIVGELFLVRAAETITAYGVPALDRRWSATVDDSREFGPIPCGEDLCSYGRHGGVRVWDTATGRTRWTSDRWDGLHRAGEELLGVSRSEPDRAGTLSVLDAATGRPVADLGAWQILDEARAAPRFIGVRIDADRRTWVAEIDARSRQVRLLTVLHGISDDCGLAEGWLYCRRVDASVGLWPLPTRP